MIARLISAWLTVATSVVVSLFLLGTSRWIHNAVDQMLAGRQLPQISIWFYPPSVWPYWFPILGAVTALFCTIRYRHSDSAWLLSITISLSVCLVFIAIYIFAMTLPWLPIKIETLNGN